MIIIVSGKPGAGKSYELVRRVTSALLHKRLVFCDIPIYVTVGSKVLVTQMLTRSMLREFAFPEGCMIAINEGGAWFDSRNFARDISKDKNAFTTDDLVVFSQHRQSDIDMVIVAQDIGMLDLNIRRCTEGFMHVKCIPPSGFEWYYKLLKLPPWFFIQHLYYLESDYNSSMPREQPLVKLVRFKLGIAKNYDTKYHRYLMQSRPVKEYISWGFDNYLGKKIMLSKYIRVPDTSGKLIKVNKEYWNNYDSINDYVDCINDI